LPARATRLQAAAAASRPWRVAGAPRQPGPGPPEQAWRRAGVLGCAPERAQHVAHLSRAQAHWGQGQRPGSAAAALQFLNCSQPRGGHVQPGRNRNARYHSALGSARETLACLEVAVVSSHITQDSAVHDQLDRVVGTLVKLVAK